MRVANLNDDQLERFITFVSQEKARNLKEYELNCSKEFEASIEVNLRKVLADSQEGTGE